MASVSATVNNGEIVTSASQASLSSANAQGSSSLDKDAFLQLLVAQMKYQDPMQPTSNTEYIAQYAQFSQVEALNNMSQTMELSRFSSYVGKEVVIESESGSGDKSQVRGLVDYVTFEGGKAYFSIEGDLYAAQDMVSVISSEYTNAEDIAKQFAKEIKELPGLDSINIQSNGNTITGLLSLYNSLSDYQRGFLNEDDVDKMNSYVSRLNDLLIAAANAAEKGTENAAAEAGETVEEIAEEITEDIAEEIAEEGLNETESAEQTDASEEGSAEDISETIASEGLVTPEEDGE
ncbi:MAG: hypothetical protein K5871_00580 [Lachnospiraceae bacterium]|nr:hypothetical protein [Lachnospiraceae bacterium]